MTLKKFDEMLPEEHFIRIHKFFLVSIIRMSSFNRQRVMLNEISLPVGRAYVAKLSERLL